MVKGQATWEALHARVCGGVSQSIMPTTMHVAKRGSIMLVTGSYGILYHTYICHPQVRIWIDWHPPTSGKAETSHPSVPRCHCWLHSCHLGRLQKQLLPSWRNPDDPLSPGSSVGRHKWAQKTWALHGAFLPECCCPDPWGLF